MSKTPPPPSRNDWKIVEAQRANKVRRDDYERNATLRDRMVSLFGRGGHEYDDGDGGDDW